MNKIKQCFIAALIAFSVVVSGLYTFVSAQGQPLTFSAFGDIPYGSAEYALLQQQIADHNRYSPSALIVHIGDIMTGSCDEKKYADVAGIMKNFAIPAYIVVGDNEYNDCGNPIQALAHWKKYFLNFEENFCGAPATEHQSVRPENLAFVLDGVLFIGINLVGGDVHDLNEWSVRMQQDADWVSQQFQAKVSQVRAAVVFAQAGPEGSANHRGPFFNQFRPAAAAFGKPILYIQGNTHAYKLAQPWPEKNITQLVVPQGNAEPPLQVTVTMDPNPLKAFIVKRNPWVGASPYNMPPCVNAGPDQTLTGTTVANLKGQATDDGDPSGALTITWSKTSGPGTVTFGNANAPVTTASFSAPGTYVLRLTADDGQLQKSDDVTIVSGGSNSTYLLSADTTGSGSVSMNPPGGIYNSGTVVTLSATPAAGFQFSGWSGDLSSSANPVTITMNANKSVTATFTASNVNSTTNLAKGKSVTASSTYSGKPAENAVDGSTSTYWRSGSVSSNPIAWLRVDLGAVLPVGRAIVKWKESYYAKSYELQVSNDDVNWTKVYSTSAGNSGTHQFTFSATTARYVRFYMMANVKSSYQIYELEVYSGAASTPKRSDETAAETVIPGDFVLEQNYPNPFNPSTQIRFGLPQKSHVTIKLYTINGLEVKTLVNGYYPAGTHTITFQAKNLPSGTYFYVMQAGSVRQVRRLVLMK
ncbi:MAG: discoidin domain-containing protein [candidate division KSB1 bacterium]|nr:discoidin domain-containing protein [candidate division KSB1 bacterium]MDZ7365674.1 discoidin domain-containing protein [candidate division KSB1 bacterium]MDZ7403250.1 discoidin domain-containing protein [candidate division KSB1 bacterium]